tara:strand:- start:534 stop:1202 length:669 start_codon:yes stop_codon:yes gene_type:complete
MFRLYFLTFEGSFKGEDIEIRNTLLAESGKSLDEDSEHKSGTLHESSWSMTYPLIFLAVPSVLIGLLGTPWNSRFAFLLAPEEALEMSTNFAWSDFLPLAIASICISLSGITLAFFAYYLRRIDLSKLVAARVPIINSFLSNKWYLDLINEKIFVKGSRKLAKEVLEVDAKVVDGVVNLTGLLTLGSGEGLKYLETGRAQFYALVVFGGVIGLVVLFGVLGS